MHAKNHRYESNPPSSVYLYEAIHRLTSIHLTTGSVRKPGLPEGLFTIQFRASPALAAIRFDELASLMVGLVRNASSAKEEEETWKKVVGRVW
jgi:hypothetical protein